MLREGERICISISRQECRQNGDLGNKRPAASGIYAGSCEQKNNEAKNFQPDVDHCRASVVCRMSARSCLSCSSCSPMKSRPSNLISFLFFFKGQTMKVVFDMRRHRLVRTRYLLGVIHAIARFFSTNLMCNNITSILFVLADRLVR